MFGFYLGFLPPNRGRGRTRDLYPSGRCCRVLHFSLATAFQTPTHCGLAFIAIMRLCWLVGAQAVTLQLMRARSPGGGGRVVSSGAGAAAAIGVGCGHEGGEWGGVTLLGEGRGYKRSGVGVGVGWRVWVNRIQTTPSAGAAAAGASIVRACARARNTIGRSGGRLCVLGSKTPRGASCVVERDFALPE